MLSSLSPTSKIFPGLSDVLSSGFVVGACLVLVGSMVSGIGGFFDNSLSCSDKG